MSIPVAAAAVIAGLLLLQGSDGGSPLAPGRGTPEGRVVKRSTYSLALPTGWSAGSRKDGSSFRAVGPAGTDATLWVERNPRLSLDDFVKRSLAQLRQVSPDARVYRRLGRGEQSTVLLRARLPEGRGGATYLVTLRAADPYRYYLATSVPAGASKRLRRQAALIHGSFAPEAGG